MQQLAAQLPWFHNIILMEKVKDLPARLWYMQQTLQHGWSRPVLHLMIQSHTHERQDKVVDLRQEKVKRGVQKDGKLAKLVSAIEAEIEKRKSE